MAFKESMENNKSKSGFSMTLKVKASTKSKPKSGNGLPAQADQDDNEALTKDFVRGIGEGRVVTVRPEVKHGPRVIPLASNPWERSDQAREPSRSSTELPREGTGAAAGGDKTAKASGQSTSSEEKTLDELAAEAIARESRAVIDARARGEGDRTRLGLDSGRVIGMSTTPGSVGSGNGGAPLLAQKMIPGMAEIENEVAKFKHDLKHRADDLNARSQAYLDVPVGEFGAALLRGMGWNGEDGDAGLTGTVEPRHNRLGLGAQPKPPEERKGSRIRKQGERSNARDEENRKNWERKAREEASRSSVALMDVVEISQAAEARVRGSGSSGKARGMVVKTQGVPGLNKVCVRLEDTGKEVILDRGKIAKVSDEDLSRRPYAPRRAEGNKNPDGRRDGKEGARGGSDSNSDGDERRDRSARRGGTRKRGRSRSRSASRSRYDEVGRPKSGVEGDGGGGEGHAGSDPDEDHDRSRRKRSKSRKDKDKDRGRSKKSGGRRESKKDKDKDDDNARGQASHADRRSARDDRGREDGTEDTSSPDRRRRRDEKYRRKSDRDRDHGRDRGGSDDGENGAGSSDDQRGEGGRGDDARFREAVWLRPNIRVRVIHRSYASGRAYLGKGKVVDVPRPGQATLRMDSGDVLEGVSQQHLETVLPGRGGKVIVVRGPEKGVTGKLLGKNKGDETALIQVFEDLRAITLSLDDVAEFTAMLDEDVEDLGY